MRVLMALIISGVWATAAPAQDFSAHWHDGRAELDGYRLQVNRYGQPRDGRAVLVYVTEPFRESSRVKADNPSRNPEDVFDALKLNLIRDFQTGIYDYNTMVSVFDRSDDFSPSKITFSSAEWCGHAYEEQVFGEGSVESRLFSYFEGETGERVLDYPSGAVTEDNLFVLLRGLRGAYLLPGEAVTVPFLPSPYVSRLTHRPPDWTTARIHRKQNLETVRVPAGDFRVMVYEVSVEGDGRTGRFHIEADYPHRIVRWEMAPDIEAELTGSIRVPYWELNGNAHERYLEDLGLTD